MKGQPYGPLETPLTVRTHADMRPVLMVPDAPGPAIHYYMIRGGSARQNVTVWQPGTVGGEYIKAFGHYHRGTFIETYTIVSGTGILLLQERKVHDEMPINDEVASIKAVHVQPGSVVEIPRNTGHALINTGSTWLVSVDNSPVEDAHHESAWPTHADYESIRDMRGFAYYVVEENGKLGFVKNPLYTNTPDIEQL